MSDSISRNEVIAVLKRRGFQNVDVRPRIYAESYLYPASGELVNIKTNDSNPLVIHPKHEERVPQLSGQRGVIRGDKRYSHSRAFNGFPRRLNNGEVPENYGLDFGFASAGALDDFLDVLLASKAPEPDTEALRFVAGFMSPENPQLDFWRPKYGTTVAIIKEALARNAPEGLFELIWRTRDNSVSNAGQGVMGFDTVDRLRERLVGVIKDVAADGSPANFESIVQRFEAWQLAGDLSNVPRLLIARAFAAIHPERYHTMVDSPRQERVIPWFVSHTGFVPRDGNWAAKAEALTAHLADLEGFGGDALLRNMFPWFVFEQMRDEAGEIPFQPGHVVRLEHGSADVSPGARNISYRHNVLQGHLYELLCSQFGKDAVRTELPTGTGGFADAVVRRSDTQFDLYEIKVAATATDAVRQAMGQLLEYAYRRGGLEPARLVVVAEPVLDDVTEAFMQRMREEFGLNLVYFRIQAPASAVMP
jgi:hypothetical protein